MGISIAQNNLLATLTEVRSINAEKASPLLGVNIKLNVALQPENSFVGMITKLNSQITNAENSIYDTMTIEGIDKAGVKKTIILTIDNLVDNVYGDYDTLYYTANLEDGTGAAIVYVENVDGDLVDTNSTIQIWDANIVKIGAMIVYRLADGTEIEGIISNVRPDVIVVTIIGSNGRPATMNLTLIDATTSNFQGAILVTTYADETNVWSDEELWNDADVWQD